MKLQAPSQRFNHQEIGFHIPGMLKAGLDRVWSKLVWWKVSLPLERELE